MQVQVNSDRHIAATDELSDQVRATVEDGLGHLARRITRIEAHLTDENGGKGGPNDKRCMLEARIKGHEPVAVNETADDLDLAVRGAVRKLEKTVGQLFDRLDEA
jgi:ribosome-associated translation inhibitor RaiA